jgi:apolipoprotein N-acyltransferase
LDPLSRLFGTRSKRFAAAMFSGALLFFTLGLHPCWLAAWIAPIPLLLATFHASRAEARLLALVASFLGLTSQFPYYVSVVGWPGVAIVLLQLLQWSFVILFTRAIVRRSDRWFTVFAFPLICAGFDTAISTFSPHGTFGSLAYTQMDALPIVQIASLLGSAGIVFIIALFPSAAALALYRAEPRQQPLLAYGPPLLLLIGVLAFGSVRLTNSAPTPASLPVGLVAIDDYIGPKTSRDKADAVWRGYDDAIAALAQQGARVVVLPEKIDMNEPAADARRAALSETARGHGIYLLAGLGLTNSGGWRNRAWLFAPSGDLVAEYDKQHLVPGSESTMTAGHENVVREIDSHRVGVAICKDMHFASLGRSYGKEQIGAMLEPAWDFQRDAWMAARIAALRGVENGYAVVHSARESILSASDRYGRFIGETPSRELPGASLLVRLPIGPGTPTLYTRFGDWFGWLCVVGAVLLRFVPAREPAGRDLKF